MKNAFRLLGALAIFTLSVHGQETSQPLEPRDGESVILFLLDNSASLPPLDPGTQRRDAIEKIYGFLQGQPYRLILFGGRNELHVDAPQFYRNAGQWTDFYYAFERAQSLIEEYPEGTDFKMVLITDGIVDPSPSDWLDQQVPDGADLKTLSIERTATLLATLAKPLYVILIGDQVDRGVIQEMVLAANGSFASSGYAQGIADFFDDDGLLLRRFIFRVEPDQGLEQIEPIVQRIAQPPKVGIELSIAISLALLIAMLVGVGVRSFPGPGDSEILELRTGEPVQVAVDRLRRLPSDVASWSWKGLSYVDSSKRAKVMMTAYDASTEVSPEGIDFSTLDARSAELVRMPLESLRKELERLSATDNKDDQIFALNLEYVAKDLAPAAVEQILTSSPTERDRIRGMEFLRAKVHLLHNPELSQKVTSPKLVYKVYGIKPKEKELRPGGRLSLGRYGFRFEDLRRGGRKDFRLELVYERVPSALWLKRIIPSRLQKIIRMRRSHERIVS